MSVVSSVPLEALVGTPVGMSRRNFLRHFLEMFMVMWVGMLAAAVAFGAIAVSRGMTLSAAGKQLSEIHLLLMIVGMTLPMALWMRYRGHGWRSTAEMSAAMFLPGLVFMGLVSLHIMTAGSACGLYCALGTPAMVVPMLFRRQEYSQDQRHHSTGQQHHEMAH